MKPMIRVLEFFIDEVFIDEVFIDEVFIDEVFIDEVFIDEVPLVNSSGKKLEPYDESADRGGGTLRSGQRSV